MKKQRSCGSIKVEQALYLTAVGLTSWTAVNPPQPLLAGPHLGDKQKVEEASDANIALQELQTRRISLHSSVL